jgi:hypothetical protein
MSELLQSKTRWLVVLEVLIVFGLVFLALNSSEPDPTASFVDSPSTTTEPSVAALTPSANPLNWIHKSSNTKETPKGGNKTTLSVVSVLVNCYIVQKSTLNRTYPREIIACFSGTSQCLSRRLL